MLVEDFAIHLKTLRKAKGLAQQEIATKIGVSSRTYQRLEYGELEPSLSNLNKISSLFDMNLSDFLEMSSKTVELEETLARSYDQKMILYRFLDLLTADISRDQALLKGLNIILSSSWLPIESKGGIFLVSDYNPEELVLTVSSKHFSPELKTLCNRVKFGHCLCGRAASEKVVIFSSCIDGRHDNQFPGMKPHGHYNVPFFDNNKKLLGVIVLYVKHDHKSQKNEIEFLEYIAKGFSNIYQRFRYDQFTKAMIVTLNHEINNPLTIASCAIDRIDKASNSQGPKVKKVKEALLRIKSTMKEMQEIDINNAELIDYALNYKMIKLKKHLTTPSR